MRVKGIVLTLLVLVSLAAPCAAQISLKPIFDMSHWTTDTYPAFGPAGTLYNANSPAASVDLGQVQAIKYSPIFDMSPGAWSFDSYPAYIHSSGVGGSTVVGMLFASY